MEASVSRALHPCMKITAITAAHTCSRLPSLPPHPLPPALLSNSCLLNSPLFWELASLLPTYAGDLLFCVGNHCFLTCLACFWAHHCILGFLGKNKASKDKNKYEHVKEAHACLVRAQVCSGMQIPRPSVHCLCSPHPHDHCLTAASAGPGFPSSLPRMQRWQAGFPSARVETNRVLR